MAVYSTDPQEIITFPISTSGRSGINNVTIDDNSSDNSDITVVQKSATFVTSINSGDVWSFPINKKMVQIGVYWYANNYS